MFPRIFIILLLCVCLVANTSCVFFAASKIQEINQRDLETLRTSHNLLVRTSNVADRLMSQLPKDAESEVAFTGLLLSDIDAFLRKIFSFEERFGLLVIGVLDQSPAQEVKEGETVIDKKPAEPRVSNNNVGEYVDFEEVEE